MATPLWLHTRYVFALLSLFIAVAYAQPRLFFMPSQYTTDVGWYERSGAFEKGYRQYLDCSISSERIDYTDPFSSYEIVTINRFDIGRTYELIYDRDGNLPNCTSAPIQTISPCDRTPYVFESTVLEEGTIADVYWYGSTHDYSKAIFYYVTHNSTKGVPTFGNLQVPLQRRYSNTISVMRDFKLGAPPSSVFEIPNGVTCTNHRFTTQTNRKLPSTTAADKITSLYVRHRQQQKKNITKQNPQITFPAQWSSLHAMRYSSIDPLIGNMKIHETGRIFWDSDNLRRQIASQILPGSNGTNLPPWMITISYFDTSSKVYYISPKNGALSCSYGDDIRPKHPQSPLMSTQTSLNGFLFKGFPPCPFPRGFPTCSEFRPQSPENITTSPVIEYCSHYVFRNKEYVCRNLAVDGGSIGLWQDDKGLNTWRRTTALESFEVTFDNFVTPESTPLPPGGFELPQWIKGICNILPPTMPHAERNYNLAWRMLM